MPVNLHHLAPNRFQEFNSKFRNLSQYSLKPVYGYFQETAIPDGNQSGLRWPCPSGKKCKIPENISRRQTLQNNFLGGAIAHGYLSLPGNKA